MRIIYIAYILGFGLSWAEPINYPAPLCNELQACPRGCCYDHGDCVNSWCDKANRNGCPPWMGCVSTNPRPLYGRKLICVKLIVSSLISIHLVALYQIQLYPELIVRLIIVGNLASSASVVVRLSGSVLSPEVNLR